ncbi:MAG: TIGR00725 family protein [Thermotogae bacterium]|nr:TIGR00725 family protein [Thermotogota bacterium]
MRQVAVIGSSEASDMEYEIAYRLGRLIARMGWVVISGGRTGVMEAVSRGSREEGGIAVGILTTYTGEDGNPYLDIRINTGMGWNRNPLVVASGEFVVAVGGRYGTLTEIGYALVLGRTVIGFRTHSVEGVENYSDPEEFLRRVEEELNSRA